MWSYTLIKTKTSCASKNKVPSSMSCSEEKPLTASSYSAHEEHRMMRKIPQTDGSHPNEMKLRREKEKFTRNFMYICF